MWTQVFAVLTLFADYLHLVDEKEYRYLFERPLIWQSYAFWMIAEMALFMGTIFSNVLFLMCRQFSRNKLPIDFQKFAFYQWAGEEIMDEIRKDK